MSKSAKNDRNTEHTEHIRPSNKWNKYTNTDLQIAAVNLRCKKTFKIKLEIQIVAQVNYFAVDLRLLEPSIVSTNCSTDVHAPYSCLFTSIN